MQLLRLENMLMQPFGRPPAVSAPAAGAVHYDAVAHARAAAAALYAISNASTATSGGIFKLRLRTGICPSNFYALWNSRRSAAPLRVPCQLAINMLIEDVGSISMRSKPLRPMATQTQKQICVRKHTLVVENSYLPARPSASSTAACGLQSC